MAKRFGDLEARALALLAAGVDPSTSQDEALRNFWAWKINPSAPSHNLPSASERPQGRKFVSGYLEPFAVELPANILAKVSISVRSNTAPNAAAVKTACEVVTALSGTDVALGLKGYTPARVYWRQGAATTSSPRTSRITNQPYKSYYAAADEGFSIPFGKKDTDPLTKRQKDIKAALPATISLVTFSPEKYRGAV